MVYPVIISYNSASHKEHAFATDLVNYLAANNIETVASDPNRSEPTMKQWLLSAQWLVLVLTPEAIRSPRVKSLVDTAFDRVRQGHMQGVLALAFSSNPVEPEDMPNSSWSTIRTYYAGEGDEDQQRTFEKIARTLGYSKVPVHGASSSANNWASSFTYNGPTASRPLPTYPQAAQKRLPLFVGSAVIVIVLLITFSSALLGFPFFKKSSSPPSLTTTTVRSTSKLGTSTPTAARGTTSTVMPENATATAVANAAQNLYNKYIKGSPNFVMNIHDPKQQWDHSGPCAFNSNGTYDITNTTVAEYAPCMEKEMKFMNFAYEAQMKIVSGDAGGLIFRSDDSITTFYRFSLTSQGDYALFLCQPPDCTSTVTDQGKSLLPAGFQKQGQPKTLVGQTETLTVIAQDNHIYLYIDKTFVGKADDPTISQGEIGVYAASISSSNTEVTFSNVQVWNIQ